jgi:signal transduction histidine kinase
VTLGPWVLSRQRAWFSSAAVIVLAVLCGVLGFLEYHSTEEIGAAERTRLYGTLHSRLDAVSRAFDQEISSACFALVPNPARIEASGPALAYAEQYARLKKRYSQLFRRVALAVPKEGKLQFLILDPARGQFLPAHPPAGWTAMLDDMTVRLSGDAEPPSADLVLERPRFGKVEGHGAQRVQEWLLVELNREYISRTLLPELVNVYVSEEGRFDYDLEVVDKGNPSDVIFRTAAPGAPLSAVNADASAALLTEIPSADPDTEETDDFGGPKRWRLLARSRVGSLGMLVKQSQQRNLAVLASILALILSTIAVLVHYSRQAQRLADLQINFMAGIAHELRTPLTVIRTAAYNLRSARLRDRPDQVERYGSLIESESGKLQGLVDHVLRDASAKSGNVNREPVALNNLLRDVLRTSRPAIEDAGVVLEAKIGTNLPPVLADSLALRHALQNLLDNALKYGREGGNWIGVHADAVTDEEGRAVRIDVSDRGPGIPADEMTRLFDPFFRGRKAVRNQVDGTGLGLNLVRTIIEAHGGSIRVKNGPSRGAAFTIRIPAAPDGFQV